jgi:hypothetical protein
MNLLIEFLLKSFKRKNKKPQHQVPPPPVFAKASTSPKTNSSVILLSFHTSEDLLSRLS